MTKMPLILSLLLGLTLSACGEQPVSSGPVRDTVCNTAIDGVDYFVLLSSDNVALDGTVGCRHFGSIHQADTLLLCEGLEVEAFLARLWGQPEYSVSLSSERLAGRHITLSIRSSNQLDINIVRTQLMTLLQLRCDTTTAEVEGYELTVADPERWQRNRDLSSQEERAVLSGNKMMFSHVPLRSLSKILTGWVGQPVRYLGDDTAYYTLSIPRRQWQSDPLKALAAQGLSFTPEHRTETRYTFQ